MSDREEPLYQKLACLVDAYQTCLKNDDYVWQIKHAKAIERLSDRWFPSGSGIDDGTKLYLDESTGEKLVFGVSFHHMNENGFYDGWTEHRVIVKPSLQFGIDIRITGRDRNNIKDYLGDIFDCLLREERTDEGFFGAEWIAEQRRKRRAMRESS